MGEKPILKNINEGKNVLFLLYLADFSNTWISKQFLVISALSD